MKRLIALAAVGLVGCTETPPAQEDLPSDMVEQNLEERTVYVNPDKFPNVVAFCDGPVRIYVTTRDTQNPFFVPDHPLCGER